MKRAQGEKDKWGKGQKGDSSSIFLKDYQTWNLKLGTCNFALYSRFFASKSSTSVFPVSQKNQTAEKFMTTAT